MKKFILLTAGLISACSSVHHTEQCRTFPQQVVNHNHLVYGEAYACSGDDGRYHVKTFKDMVGNDLPAPSQILYPQPAVIQTTPQTAFTPSKTAYAMPLPTVTFYEQ